MTDKQHETARMKPAKQWRAATTKTESVKGGSVFARNPALDDRSAALYTLWFGLDYGSILTAYALYKVLEGMGYRPFLLEKSPALWTDHYAETDNIAGKFIFSHCNVLEAFRHEESRAALDKIRTHVVGSDVLWNPEIVGLHNLPYFFCSAAQGEANIFSYASSCGKLSFPPEEINLRHDIAALLRKFRAVSVRDFRDALSINEQFHLNPEITVDPVFLCPREAFLSCAESAAASGAERGEKSFIFAYFKDGDERKRNFILRGNDILRERCRAPLRNFIDINRYQESKDALGLEPAFHILVEDWLFYLSRSDFVMTDDYYGMCFAILFEKNFVVLVNRDMPDAERYALLLEQLGLSERLVFDDFKKKEYLFRKPIRYQSVKQKLDALREDSFRWLETALADAEQSAKG